MEALPHPPYSPDMSSPDYNLFRKLKEPLRGVRFKDLSALINAVNRRIYEFYSGSVSSKARGITYNEFKYILMLM